MMKSTETFHAQEDMSHDNVTQMPGQKALVYCRVSDPKQKIKGSGLESQEHRCRDYAAGKGYEVEAVFPDDVTGGGDFIDRPGMEALLQYLDDNVHTDYVVIFDDLKRFARDTLFHWKLRHELATRHATPECLNFNFEDTPEGEFMETIFAAQGQLERQQNRRQTIQKMRARLEGGYYVFFPPVGYSYKQVQGHSGKLLIKNEPFASILQEALEGFASGRFETQTEFKRFLESQPAYPKELPNGQIRLQRVKQLLTRPLYAGYIDKPDWQVFMVKGQHEPLISLQCYERIQQRLKTQAKAPARKDINEDFPLRGFVLCGDCEKPLRAGWTKGNTKLYPYYLCQTKTCNSYGKSIKRVEIEGNFETLLQQLKPSKELFQLACATFKDAWDQKATTLKDQVEALKSQVKKLEKQIEGVVDRLVNTDNQTAITAYETRLTKLEREKIMMTEKAQITPKPLRPFHEMLELALSFLANPYKLWASERLEDKRTVLKLAFSTRIAYDRETGYRTPKISFPFKLLGDLAPSECKMVPGGGIEPPLCYQNWILNPARLPVPPPRHRV